MQYVTGIGWKGGSRPVRKLGGGAGEPANDVAVKLYAGSEERSLEMCVEFPEVRIGEPRVCGGASVFPLFAELPLAPVGVDYVLASEVIAAGTLTVQEVSETGEVPCLLADNGGDRPALFVEGEEVRGGKQNRILASSVLVAGRSRTRVPVACTERGRWDDSRPFTTGSSCPPSLRYLLKEEADGRQSRIWETIRRKHRATATCSGTENLSDVLDVRREAAEGLRHGLPYVEGALGIAVALGARVVGIDVFDRTATCQGFWGRFAESLLLDAAETPHPPCRANRSELAVKLYMLKSVRWRRYDSTGLGEAYRGRGDDDILATALVAGGELVHLSVSMPC